MGACGGREQPPWGAGSAATWELVRVGPWPAEGTMWPRPCLEKMDTGLARLLHQ